MRSADPQPDYEIEPLPRDLTLCSDADLMDHLRTQVEWRNFFATLVVLREAAEAEAEADYETAKSMAYNTEGKDSVTEAKAARDGDPVVIGSRRRWQQAKTDRKAMQVVMENREQAASVVSREVSRRIGREGNQRRADRYGGS